MRSIIVHCACRLSWFAAESVVQVMLGKSRWWLPLPSDGQLLMVRHVRVAFLVPRLDGIHVCMATALHEVVLKCFSQVFLLGMFLGRWHTVYAPIWGVPQLGSVRACRAAFSAYSYALGGSPIFTGDRAGV